MGRVLARNGYQVLTAQDGLEALTVYCSCPTIVKLVITDVMMPQMDGIKLTRALRKLNPQLPIIASSGHSEEPHRKELGELGVQVFLRKPYNAESLLRSLGEIRNAKAAT
jgi:CheY-like chemotaxis protein